MSSQSRCSRADTLEALVEAVATVPWFDASTKANHSHYHQQQHQYPPPLYRQKHIASLEEKIMGGSGYGTD